MWNCKFAFVLILIPPIAILTASNGLFEYLIPTDAADLRYFAHTSKQLLASVLIESLYGWGMSQLLVLGMSLTIILYALHRVLDLPDRQRRMAIVVGAIVYFVIAGWQLRSWGEFENPLTAKLYEATIPLLFAEGTNNDTTQWVKILLSWERLIWHAAGVLLFLAAASTIAPHKKKKHGVPTRIEDLRARQYHLRRILYLGALFLVVGLVGIKSVLDVPLDQFAAFTDKALAETISPNKAQKYLAATAQHLGDGLSLFWSSTITALAVTLYVAPAVVQRIQARYIFNDIQPDEGAPSPAEAPPQQFDEWLIDKKLKDSAGIAGWSSQVVRILTVVSPLIAGPFVDALKTALS